MRLPRVSALILSLLSLATANAPIHDVDVQSDLAMTGGARLAYAARPVWHFGLFEYFGKQYTPCYPSAPLIDGEQHGTQPDEWPRASTNCVSPGALAGGEGNPFPTYYVVKPCGENEIRVIYALYYTHDGFSNVVIARGHEHDWERIVVIWSRDATTRKWTRSRLLKSFHSGYMAHSWADIPSTVDAGSFLAPAAEKKNGDNPLLYPGWAKHAMFDDKETFWHDPASQGCSREYREGHWWYLPRAEDLVDASGESVAGKELAKFDWGSATGSPWHAEVDICSAKEGGYVWC